MKNVLVWGWGAPGGALVVDRIRRETSWNVTWISDHPQADFNIHRIFRGEIASAPDRKSVAALMELVQSPDFHLFEEFFSRHWKAYEYDRHSTKDILALYVHFFDRLLRERAIDGVVLATYPHEGPDLILARLAERRNLKIITYYQFYLRDRSFFTRAPLDLPFKSLGTGATGTCQSFESMLPDQAPFYMASVANRRRILLERLKLIFRHFAKGIVRRKMGDFYRMFKEIQYTRRILTLGNASLPDKFVYFPLHLQPEGTTSALGGIFVDQALAIEALRAMLPDDIGIVLKENPKQSSLMRDESFYRRVGLIPGVGWAPTTMSSFDLIRRSQFVATIAGTAGWEALLREKPTLIFGSIWYENAPGLSRYRPDLSFQEVMAKVPTRAELKKFYEDLSGNLNDFVVDFEYAAALEGFDSVVNAEKVVAHLRNELSKQ